ncbi:Adenosylhopane nucleosidase, HpnG [Caenispirillum salinarum AK4]|uniref:Adenosylhopane nucleosidase, HpnG n=1 Tax=Caenispirillum salinarum AK4 TaxID=1238182 RepID=K9HDP6_9PROT|nr:adenosylhopane nucleosidase [Caenispirillum salinarum]EKV28603.1 Adenosylhopane nucleosidase, HpnG [Caenispirillum salinarum AK4]
MGAVEGIGAVTGLHAETVLARRLGMRAACCGIPPGRAEDLAEELVEEQNVVALVSFGLCGGLDPAVAPGTLVIPDRVVGEDDYTGFPTDTRWRSALLDRLPEARTGRLLGHDRIVATVAEKAELFALTEALAVDTESTGVATVAQRHGLPFMALRAVCDPATMALPRAALVAVTETGRVDAGAVLRAVLRHPGEIGRLVRLGAANRAAMKALLRGGAVLGPTLS